MHASPMAWSLCWGLGSSCVCGERISSYSNYRAVCPRIALLLRGVFDVAVALPCSLSIALSLSVSDLSLSLFSSSGLCTFRLSALHISRSIFLFLVHICPPSLCLRPSFSPFSLTSSCSLICHSFSLTRLTREPPPSTLLRSPSFLFRRILP